MKKDCWIGGHDKKQSQNQIAKRNIVWWGGWGHIAEGEGKTNSRKGEVEKNKQIATKRDVSVEVSAYSRRKTPNKRSCLQVFSKANIFVFKWKTWIINNHLVICDKYLHDWGGGREGEMKKAQNKGVTLQQTSSVSFCFLLFSSHASLFLVGQGLIPQAEILLPQEIPFSFEQRDLSPGLAQLRVELLHLLLGSLQRLLGFNNDVNNNKMLWQMGSSAV